MTMIRPENWSDTVLLDGALPRTPEERASRLFWVWYSMQELPGIPERIGRFIRSEGHDTQYGLHSAWTALEDEVNGLYDTGMGWFEVERALLEAMNDDAAQGYVVIESDDGHILYLSESEAIKEGHIEE